MDFGDAARADGDGRAEAYEAGRDESRGLATGRVWGILAEMVSDMKRGRCDAGALWLMAGSHAGTWFAEAVRQGWASMRDELLQVARYRRHEGDTVTVWRGPGWVRLAVQTQEGEVVIVAEAWRPVEVGR